MKLMVPMAGFDAVLRMEPSIQDPASLLLRPLATSLDRTKVMKVLFMCGYLPEAVQKCEGDWRDYHDAALFCQAVRTGEFEHPFAIHTQKEPVRVQEKNVGVARRAFGRFIERRITEEVSWPSPVLVPMPSEEAVIGVGTFRSWFMLNEAMAPTELKLSPVDALFWRETPPKNILDAGQELLPALAPELICDFPLRGQAVVLIDDLVSSGTTLLAARDCLQREGAAVLGAIVCGKVIHDFKTPAFGRQEFWVDDDVAASPS